MCLLAGAVSWGQEDPEEAYRRATNERIDALERELEQLRSGAKGDEAGDDELDDLLGAAEEAAGEEKPPEAESFVQKALNLFNPRITAFGDFTARLGLHHTKLREDPTDPTSPQVDDRFNLREAEIDFRAAVDPYADAVLIVAYESEEPGELAGEVLIEEGYVTLNFLPFGFTPKIGRFHVGFGRVNVLHGHDLPQPEYPLPVQEFLGEEGMVEQGLSLQWLIPNPLDLSITWTTEVINGENAPILAGGSSEHPAAVSRLSYFQEIGESFSLEAGGSVLFGYNDDRARQESLLTGGDLLLRWRPRKESQRWSVVAQGELFYLDIEGPTGTPSNHSFGAYAYLQIQAWQNWYLGFRYEYADHVDDDRSNTRRAGVYLSYYTSEFLRLRVGYEHTEYDFSRASGLRAPTHDGFVFQLTFVFGSHPVEPYWVNR